VSVSDDCESTHGGGTLQVCLLVDCSYIYQWRIYGLGLQLHGRLVSIMYQGFFLDCLRYSYFDHYADVADERFDLQTRRRRFIRAAQVSSGYFQCVYSHVKWLFCQEGTREADYRSADQRTRCRVIANWVNSCRT
jgi:hypothetical protein